MTMGAWVDHVLASAANAELSSRPPAGADDTPPSEAGLPAAADGLAERVGELERREHELLAMVERAAERGVMVSEEPAPGPEVRRAHALTEAVYGLVQRIEAHLRPVAQLGQLARRLEASDERHRQMLVLMERMAEAERRRAGEMAAMNAALARIESRLGQPLSDDAARIAEVFGVESRGENSEALEFGTLNERAVANSRKAGQRPPDEAGGFVGRLFGRRPD